MAFGQIVFSQITGYFLYHLVLSFAPTQKTPLLVFPRRLRKHSGVRVAGRCRVSTTVYVAVDYKQCTFQEAWRTLLMGRDRQKGHPGDSSDYREA